MDLVLIADTHLQHADLVVPDGDVLIHAGDFSEGSGRSGYECTQDFLDWFTLQPHKHKIFIAGNHDFWAEKNRRQLAEEARTRGLIYLMDEWTEIDNVKFWGTPWVPGLPNWAFHERSIDYANRRLAHTDTDVDVMISHGPPRGILDEIHPQFGGPKEVGCPELYEWAMRYGPTYLVCGHIHERYGVIPQARTTFINASVVDENYLLTNDPVVVTL